MMEWSGENPNRWSYASGAQSEGYHYLRTTKSKNAQGSIYKSCRVSAHRVPNVYLLGSIDYTDPQGLSPEQDYELSVKHVDKDDNGVSICYTKNDNAYWHSNFDDLSDTIKAPTYTSVQGSIKDKMKSKGWDYQLKWSPSEPSSGWNWVVSCNTTGKSGGGRVNDVDYAVHTIRIWDNRDYGMVSASNNRLINFSDDNLEAWKWTGDDAGDQTNDGYRIEPGVAQVTKADANQAAGKTDVNISENEDSTTPDPAEQGTTCEVEGIGWIVCPVMNFMAKINDAALSFLGDNFLNISPGLLQDQSARVAWNSFRDIANILFVVLFLFIIYSQMTGAGISNYGIKRMLPKLIAAAILVNASYILCQIAIDLSNIVGANISQFFGRQLPTGVSADSGEAYTGLGDLSWGKTTLAVLAIAATAIVALALLFALGLPVLLVLAMIVLILIARKALIILLVVTSPVAFLAYLLPNTENIFKKWWGLFKAMLLLYPIIGMVFGASLLAATIINNAAGGDVLIQLTALAVTALPLFAVPLLLKGAMAGTGAIGAKLAGGLDRSTGMAGKGAKDRLKRRAENLEARAAGSNNRLLRAAGGYRNRRGFKRKEMEHDTARRQEEALAGHIDRHPGRYTAQQRAAAAAALDKRYEEEVKGAGSSLQLRMSHDQILAAAERGRDHEGNQLNEHERDAAIRYAMERGNFSERQAIATGAGTMTRSQRKSLASGMRAKGDTEVYGNAGIAALEQTDVEGATGMSADDATIALQEGVVNKINNGELSVETITKDHRVAGFVAGAALGADATARGTLQADITRYQTDNPQAWAKLDTATRTHTSSI